MLTAGGANDNHPPAARQAAISKTDLLETGPEAEPVLGDFDSAEQHMLPICKHDEVL